MKNGLVLAGLASALLCAAAVWLLLGRSSPPAPAGADAPGLASAAKPAEPARAHPSEKLQVEPAAKSEPAAPAPAPEPAPPAAEPRRGPTPRADEFLPYPNAGESDFKLKYAGLDLAALAKAKAALQLLFNEEQSRLAEERFALGLFQERILDPHNPSAPIKPLEPPEGQGDVLESQKTELQPDGTIKNKTTFLTQGENPEFFGHVAELKYLSNLWKQAGGH